MDQSRPLAIIIPAYKQAYLDQVLQSLVAQSNQNFRVYIGNDCSPYDLGAIVEKYQSLLDIVYHVFDENIGGQSLIQQWERCIALSHEPWIWLFSDDDVAGPDCVAKFYASQQPGSLFYKFNTQVIDAKGQAILQKHDAVNQFKPKIEALDFIQQRLDCINFRSFAVEYIFHRELYQSFKFKAFPLAWASDDATWLCYALANQACITGINATVQWRWSGSNISSSVKNQAINAQKIEASLQYTQWLRGYAQSHGLPIEDAKILKWLSIQIASVVFPIGFSQYKTMLNRVGLSVNTWALLKNFMVIKYYHLRNKF